MGVCRGVLSSDWLLSYRDTAKAWSLIASMASLKSILEVKVCPW